VQETKPKVLIVDDDQAFRKTLLERLELKGFDAAEAASGPDALQAARSQRIDFAVVDMRMPGMDGLVTIEKLKEINPSMRSVLLTGVGSEKLKEASEALEASYFEKNDMSAFWEFLGRMQKGPGMIVFAPQGGGRGFNLEDMEVMAAKQALDRQASAGDSFTGSTLRLIGQTPAMQELKQTIDKVAALDCTLLILGETGTGK
jgi:two-component system response regulator AtoC